MSGIIKEITYNIDRNGCFVCTSHAPSNRGYPRIKRHKVPYRLHRWIYQKMYGLKLTTNMHVHHTCQNKMCINFQHLKVTTRSEHLRDHARESIHRGKVTERQVKGIINDKTHTQETLARLNNISQTHVSRIKNGYRRKCLRRINA